MEFTTAPCVFGHACIVTTDGLLCGIDIAPSAEEALLLSATRFSGVKDPKIFIPYNSKPSLDEDILNAINTGNINPRLLKSMVFVTGSFFDRKIWKELLSIDSGSVISYKQLSDRLGCPKSFRAVANACGRNPIAIVVPCHRVISSNGSTGGYRWGIEIKRQLLARENNTNI